jgi:hypothetical protein
MLIKLCLIIYQFVDYGDRLKEIFGLQSVHVGGDDIYARSPSTFQTWLKSVYREDIRKLKTFFASTDSTFLPSPETINDANWD